MICHNAMKNEIILVTDVRGLVGYLIAYGPKEVEAFSAAGMLLGCFTDRACAAAEITRCVGIWSTAEH
jgi:hypothetical protein